MQKKNAAGKLAIGSQLFCLCTMLTGKVLTVINVLRQSEVLQSGAATSTSLGSDRIILIGCAHACKLSYVQYNVNLVIQIYQISKGFLQGKTALLKIYTSLANSSTVALKSCTVNSSSECYR